MEAATNKLLTRTNRTKSNEVHPKQPPLPIVCNPLKCTSSLYDLMFLIPLSDQEHTTSLNNISKSS